MITREEFDWVVTQWVVKEAPMEWRLGQKIFNSTEEMFGSAISREMDVDIHANCFYVRDKDEDRNEKIEKFKEESYKNYCTYCSDYAKFEKRIMDEAISYSKHCEEKDFNKLLYVVAGRLFGRYIPEVVGKIVEDNTNSSRVIFIKKCFDALQNPVGVIDAANGIEWKI
jgi:hypothetical protein